MAWFKLADRLRTPLQRCQKETTSTEFVDWIWYMEWEEIYGFHRIDHYLAQIAAEVRRTISKKPSYVKLSQYLLRFQTVKKKRKPTKAEIERYTAFSKARWRNIAGVK